MHYRSPARWLSPLLLALLSLAISPLVSADIQTTRVDSSDGVMLAVQESGNPDGSPIIFIHGLLGSHLNWEKQLDDPALQEHRLITYDLRGHGLSSKPSEEDAYTDGRLWADDLDAVIQALDVRDPVLVGWSLGGAVISNYLAAYGDGDIAGAVYVDGVVELSPDLITPHPDVYPDMVSSDLKTQLDGENAFLRLCFHQQPDTPTFERLVANAALASPAMQHAVMSMTIPAKKGIGSASVPLLFLYGGRDALVNPSPTIERARQFNPDIERTIYADSGHAPFLEEPARFNRDLLAFAARLESERR